MNFLKKIFSPIFLIISLSLLIFIFYQSEFYFNGNRRIYFKIYYIISLLLILFSFISFFISHKIKEYLIIVGISLVPAFYIFEGYLIHKDKSFKDQSFKYQLLKEQLYKKKTGNIWDIRNRITIYKDLKEINDTVVMKVSPREHFSRNSSFLPLSGISNSQTIYCNENGYYSIYHSDRYGFNNPDTEWDKPEIEYLLVGDSFTHGACVNRPNDIGSVLRGLSDKSVLNLGYSANGPLIELATLREYLNSNVKKIIWIYFEGNDLKNLADEKKHNILINYLNDSNFTQNLKSKQNEIDELALNIISEKEVELKNNKGSYKNSIINFIKISNTRSLIFSSLTPKPVSELDRLLRQAKNLAENNNSKLYFVYLPQYSRYVSNFDDTNYNLVKNIVSKLNIPFIDIHSNTFIKEKNPQKFFPFELDGHYNIEGYKIVARTIYNFTKD